MSSLDSRLDDSDDQSSGERLSLDCPVADASIPITDYDSDVMDEGIDVTGEQGAEISIYSGNPDSRAIRLAIIDTPDGTELMVPAMAFYMPRSTLCQPSDMLGLAEELYNSGAEDRGHVTTDLDGTPLNAWVASAGRVVATRYLWHARTVRDFQRSQSRLLAVPPTEPPTESQSVPQDYVLEMESRETQKMPTTLPVTWKAGKGKLKFDITPPTTQGATVQSELGPLKTLTVMGMTDDLLQQVKQGGGGV